MQTVSRRGFVGGVAAGVGGLLGGSVVGGSAAKSWARAASEGPEAAKWAALDARTLAKLRTAAAQLPQYAAIHQSLVRDGFRPDAARGELNEAERAWRRSAVVTDMYRHISNDSLKASLQVWWKGRTVKDVRAVTLRRSSGEWPVEYGMVTFEDGVIKKESFQATRTDAGLVIVEVAPDGDHCMGVWVTWCDRLCDEGGLDPECYGTCMFRCGTLSHPAARALCSAACPWLCEDPPGCCDWDGQSMRACY